MKIEVVMPKMGESLQEGTIIKWFKKEGEKVDRDEMILEISTDKVDTEVPSPIGGILSKILVPEGTTVEVGSVIAYIETEASGTPEEKVEAPSSAPVVEQAPTVEQAPAAPAPTAAATGSLIDVVMPKMGESLQEGTIIKWFKKEGEKVDRDEMILEISTDKVDTEVPSPVGGVLVKILVPEGTTVEVGSVIAQISSSAAPVAAPAAPAEAKPAAQTVAATAPAAPQTTVAPVVGKTYDIPARVDNKFFSPLVREIAKQNKISLEELMSLNGSGSEGRLTKDDVLSYIANRGATPIQSAPVASVEAPKAIVPAAPTAPVVKPAAPIIASGDDTEIIPMDRVRQLISEHMVYSKHTSAHVTSVGEADVTAIVKLRDKLKDGYFKREGLKLTFTPFFADAAISAIKKFPMVNVSVDGKNIIRHKKINLSFATALDDGNLIVPVIKNADSLNLSGLQKAITDLSSRARAKKLVPDEIQGGTFTITNVGTFGTLFGTPVINQPQVAIMGIGAIKKRPVVKEVDGEHLVVVRDMVYVSITYDHRVVDGMLAGQWLAEAIRVLESMNENTISL